MTIPCSLYPLGTSLSKYKPNEIVCDISNGETATINLCRGVYYIRAQGAGGGGGRAGFADHGFGGSSGAAFEGTIKIAKSIEVTVTTGVAGKAGASGYDAGTAGTPTTISEIMSLGGGGGSHYSKAGDGGVFEFIADSSLAEILNATKQKDGYKGIQANRYDMVSGANSALTGTGGGLSKRPATAPGAGGGGGYQSFAGDGSYGECLIKFIRP